MGWIICVEVVVWVDCIEVLVVDVFEVLWIYVWCNQQVGFVGIVSGVFFEEFQCVYYVVGFIIVYVVGDQCGGQCWVLVVVVQGEQGVVFVGVVELIIGYFVEV